MPIYGSYPHEGPLKKIWGPEQQIWMRNNPGKTMTIFDLPGILRKTWPQSAVSGKIIKGFEVTGIYPFNRNIFTDVEYAPSFVTDRSNLSSTADEETARTNPSNQSSNTTGADEIASLPVASTSQDDGHPQKSNSGIVSYTEEWQVLKSFLEQKSKQMEIVVGDGHCLLHAFAMSLEAEKIAVSSVGDLCSKLKNEIEQHLSFYRPFSMNEGIDSYIYSNQYNINTADLVLCALCNALMVTAVICEVRGSSVITLSHEPGRPGIESRGKIFLTLHGYGASSHYSAVVEKSSQQPLTNVVTEEIFSPEKSCPILRHLLENKILEEEKGDTQLSSLTVSKETRFMKRKRKEKRAKRKKLIICHKDPKR